MDEMERKLMETASAVRELDAQAVQAARERMDGLLKPPGSLGRFEEIAIQLAGIQGITRPLAHSKLSLVYAADHGVVAEGVSASPAAVTATMVQAFSAGKGGINTFARVAGAALRIIDVGVASAYVEPEDVEVRRIRKGTGNIRVEAAMSREEALRALEAGMDTVRRAMKETGATVVGIGEMGIGNSSPAAALTAVFTGSGVAAVTGGGTGIGPEGVKHKIRVLEDALAFHNPNPADPVGVLSALGGLEIAAMAGAMLAAAAEGALVIVDGFISGAAALVASALAPWLPERALLSHLSPEPGHQVMANKLGMNPLLDFGCRLGEGSGAAAVMPLVEGAALLLTQMGTLRDEEVVLQDAL